MPAKTATRIRVSPDRRSPVYFEFPLRNILNHLATEIESIEAERQAGLRITGVRALHRLKIWLESLSAHDCSVFVPDEFATWFVAQGFCSTKRCFAAIYCPDCHKTYPKQSIDRKRWCVARPSGFARGGANGAYFSCPRGHNLYEISRRMS